MGFFIFITPPFRWRESEKKTANQRTEITLNNK